MAAIAILHSLRSCSTTPQSSTSDSRKPLIKKGTTFCSADLKQAQTLKRRPSSIARKLNSFVISGQMMEALTFFHSLKNPDSFLWNLMIRGYTNNCQYQDAIVFYYQMQQAGYPADNFTFPTIIKSCTKLQSCSQGLKFHGQLLKLGLGSDVYICNSLIAMYSKLGLIEYAEGVFFEMPARETVSWNALIDGYASNGEGLKSLSRFKEMQEDFGLKPDQLAVMSTLEACCIEMSPKNGKEIHCYVIRQGLELEIKVATTLLDMYCNCGEMIYAERLFSLMSNKNVVAWNVMLNGYSLNNQPEMAVASLFRMQENGTEPDTITMVNLLPSLAQMGSLSLVKSVHGIAMRKGLLPHLFLETALIDAYAECRKISLAKQLFDKMPEKSLVSWNVMIYAYVQNGNCLGALDLFLVLLMEGPLLMPDVFTISSIIAAYSELPSLRNGKQIHGYVFKLGYESNTLIQNSIIYMYARCGDLKASSAVFDKMRLRDVITWNTIILANAVHGEGRTALYLFSDMKRHGFKPNERTFVSVLSACSVSGFIDEGWLYFGIMQERNVTPLIEHYGCMVDLLGRSGDLGKAMKFIERMPLPPTSRIWGSLLTASKNNSSIEVAEFAAEKIFNINHDNTGCYVILYSMYADAGRWEDAERVRSLMKGGFLHRTTGRSLVELNSKTCSFVEEDKSYDGIDTIQLVTDILTMQVGDSNDISITRFSPQGSVNISPPERHSVRLALSFGLISSAVGTPILIKKNIRICNDCHSAMKKISSFTGREIIVGDTSIYHHFSNGRCCCGDYW